jgi:hypothetical protein
VSLTSRSSLHMAAAGLRHSRAPVKSGTGLVRDKFPLGGRGGFWHNDGHVRQLKPLQPNPAHLMDWYYTEGGQQRGPVNAAEFQQLVAQGVVTAQTLVWRQGLANWQTYESTGVSPAPAPVSLPPIAALPAGYVTCAGCGGSFPEGEVILLAGRPYCATCKPLAIQRLKEGVSGSAAEDVRNEYLKHEASVKSIGLLYYLGAVGFFLAGLGGMMVALSKSSGPEAMGRAVGSGAFLLLIGILQFWIGRGLRRLNRQARIPTGILSGLGLLAIPIGTIINAYILYLIFSAKGKMVFSDEYKDVIAQTPHIKYRTSILVWILLGLIVLIIGAALILPLFARMGARR